MGNFFRGIIRASSFLRREIFEMLRQPRLVATLVLGPFLILFLFGIGYRNQARDYRTLFVVPANGAISAQEIQQYSKALGSLIIFKGISSDLKSALDQLHQGNVDLVIQEPDNALATIKNNQPAIFTLYHDEIDPTQVNFIDYVGWLFVGAVNQHVLYDFAAQGQKDAVQLHANLADAHQNISDMRKAIQAGDQALAQQSQLKLASNVDTISLAAMAGLGLVDGVQQTSNNNAATTQATLADLRQNTSQLGSGNGTKDARLARLDKTDQEITTLDGKLTEFQSISPAVIVSPFGHETKSEANFLPTILDFFIPAVLALLLQHLAVTFAALSIVRERYVGTMELFRVSPLSAAEALLGKYISYMIFGGVIAAILSALLVFILHVPMLGNWWYFTLVISVILFTSLGIGFVISILSENDSQAVQYSMIVLLASVFFSGFILSLDQLLPSVKIISWMLPVTYGTVLLRDIVLRGLAPDWQLLGELLAIGLVLMYIAWLLIRRLIASSR